MELKAETVPKPEWRASIHGISIYVNPNISDGTVLLRNSDHEVIGYIYNVTKIEIGR